MAHILIVEDEPSIAQSLEYILQTDGFTTDWLQLGKDVKTHLQKQTVNLIILDVGLPDTSGFEVCKQVRQLSEVPIIFLTARSEEIDRVVGLEIGADDYVTKPFSPREVVARVRAILKRTGYNNAPLNTGAFHPLVFEQNQYSATYFSTPLNLTKAEYLLLDTLHRSPNQVFSRDQLLETLGVSITANYDRTIDTHIKSIRAKLRAINGELNPIKTERGFGYQLSWDKT